ncbi:hypothetical protein CURTO8I2_130075 [Curtobacterium sp. 8I-2]|nr:hypothetical protein CURTO8I2_130075 [Curtobacterium sp. 8I-2]
MAGRFRATAVFADDLLDTTDSELMESIA